MSAADEAGAAAMTASGNTVVIVGAGHAGAEAATAIRQAGHAGRIVLIGEEACLPYHRPPLSKAYLSGTASIESLALKPAAVYAKAAIELKMGIGVLALDRSSRMLSLSDGEQLKYDKLVLATGSRPRRLAVNGLSPHGKQPANLFYLRTVTDVDAIRARLVPGAKLLIAGGGYIGLEVAAAAVKIGLQVTVLEAQPRILARVASPAISAFFEALHDEAGVEILANTQLDCVTIDEAGDITSARTSNGRNHAVDLLIAGVGVMPNCELAQDAGLSVDNGIVVDQFMCTSDPDILAIGDCANHPHPVYQRRIRVESVPNALEQARVAASMIVGKPQAHAAIPWFWSDQYHLKLQMTGLSAGYDRTVVRGSVVEKSFIVFYLKDGIVISADCINRPQEFMQARKLVAAMRRFDPVHLADETLTLKFLLESLPA